MTKNELTERIEKEKIPKMLCSFDKGYWGDEYVLVHTVSNKWSVYYYERGEYDLLEEFSSEEGACEFIYQKIKKYSK